ncbi:uncharacterized protein LOC129315251 [Prosopis cineraria]|uniref:uncharacterized protein LOC129315251 n=1 Tax=Prosopis cineraria TaxID=364024 RepID=UPI002410581B|nr:uncharacterized protein LOC129315251 [Prosopis cineraria]XP_054814811.1 uncharacterized protein LOC129315251 [Prosopis cineraria]
MPPSSEGENENDLYSMEANNSQSLLLQRETTYNHHSNSHNFCSRRQDSIMFLDTNNFNFSHEAFPSNLIYAPLIPVLLSFLQIQSSATSLSPFKLHPIIFEASIICSVAYYFIVAMKFLFRGFASRFGVLVPASSSVAVALLICLILQLTRRSVFIILLLLGGFLKFLNEIHKGKGDKRRGSQSRARELPFLPLHDINVISDRLSIQD